MKMPILFVGHGSPMNAIEDNEYTKEWINISKKIPEPKGIIAISAHWYTRGTRITSAKNPKTIYDMYGFPRELYEIEYNAGTNEELIGEIKKVENSITEDSEWGYDHGVWSILHKMYPNRNIPVVEMSVDGLKTAQEHFDLGKKLHRLRNEGYLIMASGNVVHNLGLVNFESEDGYAWAKAFDDEVKNAIVSRDFKKLLDYRLLSNKAKAFSSDEHFLPLLYILGASSEEDKLTVFNEKTTMGSLSMTSYLFQ